jgi:outer membrane protein assembly factor BamB
MRVGTTGLGALGGRALLAASVAATTAAVLGGCGGGGHADPAWGAPNADLRNTRHVGGPIDAASVSKLRVAWKVPAGGTAATPVVVGGVAYTQDFSSNVTAIDVGRGKVLWTKRYDEPDVGPNGVTVGGGRLYGATETRAFALDPKTGRELWSKRLVRNAHEGIDMAPGYAGATVYVSTVPTNVNHLYQGGARGVLWAIDGASGRTRWTWAEVSADLWGDAKLNAGGGLWHPPAFDGHGSLYADIGNPAPFPGTAKHPWGASRPGPNAWTNSIVKLNARTGKLAWARQVLPHDLFDWDLECPVILARAHGREIALAAGKMGFVYAFDAATGGLLWKRSVGTHNGHDGDNLKALRGHAAELKSPVDVLPGQLGGVLTPMASDGATVYVPVVDLPATYTAQGQALVQDPASNGTGELVAIEIASGRVKWDRTLPHVAFGAATVANDVVFTTTFDGTVWALRTDTGRTAWSAKLPGGTNTPVAIAGDTLLAAASVPNQPGQRTAIVAYRLGR